MPDRTYDATRCEQHGKDLDMIVAQMQKLTDAKNEQTTELRAMRVELGHAREEIGEIKTKLDSFCAREDFVLLRTQWYYFVGLLATGVVGGVLALVFKGGK
jgi:chromosome segregation ATPase